MIEGIRGCLKEVTLFVVLESIETRVQKGMRELDLELGRKEVLGHKVFLMI